MKVVVETALGRTASRIAVSDVPILKLYEGARYGGRDANVGGDGWVTPFAESVISSIQNQIFGDFSNMHAGSFRPDHASHQTGLDADGIFDGYLSRNASTAQTILGHLNSEQGGNIERVFVTFSSSGSFANTINGVTLTDGRLATDVIHQLGGHETHYHYRMYSEEPVLLGPEPPPGPGPGGDGGP